MESFDSLGIKPQASSRFAQLCNALPKRARVELKTFKDYSVLKTVRVLMFSRKWPNEITFEEDVLLAKAEEIGFRPTNELVKLTGCDRIGKKKSGIKIYEIDGEPRLLNIVTSRKILVLAVLRKDFGERLGEVAPLDNVRNVLVARFQKDNAELVLDTALSSEESSCVCVFKVKIENKVGKSI